MACKYIYKGITYSSKEEFINKVIPTLQNSTLSKFDKVPTNKQVYNASIKNYEDNIVNFEKAIQAIKDNNYKIILPNNTGRYVASVESEGIRGGTIPIAENPYTKEAKEGKFDKEYALSYLKERIEIEKGSIENENRKIKDIEKVENDVYNKNINSNQFLQLLNKDNNWVKFFIQSIIQDSAKKGYEKVLFPTGNTASKVEGHTTLEEFKKQKEDRIKQIEKGYDETIQKLKDFYLEDVRYIKKDGKFFKQNAPYVKSIEIQENEFTDVINTKLKETKDNNEVEITQLKQELERVEKEGFAALRPIYKFYEETISNILKKQGYNPERITDEYGNDWYEVEIKQEDTSRIYFSKPTEQLTDEQQKIFKDLQVEGLIGKRPLTTYTGKQQYFIPKYNSSIWALKGGEKDYRKKKILDNLIKENEWTFIRTKETENAIQVEVGDFGNSFPRIFDSKPSNTESTPAGQITKQRVLNFLKNIGFTNIEKVKQLMHNGIPVEGNAYIDFIKGVMQIVEGEEDVALTEEGMHILVELIQFSDTELFRQLEKEVVNYQLYRDLINDEKYTNDSNYKKKDGSLDYDKLKKEAIAKLLAEHLVANLEGKEESIEKITKLASLWSAIKYWIRKVFLNYKNPFKEALEKLEKDDTSFGIFDDIKSTDTFFSKSAKTADELDIEFAYTKDTFLNIKNAAALDGFTKIGSTYYKNEVEWKGKRVSSLSKDYYDNLFRNTPLDPTMIEQYKQMAKDGDYIHLIFEDAFKSLVDTETGLLKNIDGALTDSLYPSEIHSRMGRTIQKYVRNVLESYPEGTRFLAETIVYSKSKDLIGTIDFLAIEPDTEKKQVGNTNILDWKTKRAVEDFIKDYKQTGWSLQLAGYKTILETGYNIHKFGKIRAIPIDRTYDRDGDLVRVIIGDIDPLKVDKFWLRPVISTEETTGNELKDNVIASLRSIYNKYRLMIKDKKLTSTVIMRDINEAIYELQVSDNFDQLKIYINEQFHRAVELSNRVDANTNSDISILNSLIGDMNIQMGIFDALQTIQNLYIQDETIPLKNRDELRAQYDKLSNRMIILNNKLHAVVDTIAKQNGIYNLIGPEKIVRGLSTWARAMGDQDVASIRLMFELVKNEYHKIDIEADNELKVLTDLKFKFDEYKKTNNLTNDELISILINKEFGTLHSRIDKSFYEKRLTVQNNKNKKEILEFVNDNYDIEKWKEWYKKELDDNVQIWTSSASSVNKDENTRIFKNKKLDFEQKYNILKYPLTAFTALNKQVWSRNIKADLWKSKEYEKIESIPVLLEIYNFFIKKNKELADIGAIEDYNVNKFLPSVLKSASDIFSIKDKSTLNKISDMAVQSYRNFKRKLSVSDYQMNTQGKIDELTNEKIEKRFVPYVDELESNWELIKKIAYDLKIIDKNTPSLEISKNIKDYRSKPENNKIFAEKLIASRNMSFDIFTIYGLMSKEIAKEKYLSRIDEILRGLKHIEKNKQNFSTNRFSKTTLLGGKTQLSQKRGENYDLFLKYYRYLVGGEALQIDNDYTFKFSFRHLWNKLPINEKYKFDIKEDDNKTEISVSKMLLWLNNINTLKTLGLNASSAISNLFGSSFSADKLFSNKISRKDLLEAWTKITGCRFYQSEDMKKQAALVDYFLPLLNNRENFKSSQLSVGDATKILSQDWLMWPQRTGDEVVQLNIFFAYIENTGIIDGKLVNLRELADKEIKGNDYWHVSPEERKQRDIDFEKKLKDLKDKYNITKLSTFKKEMINGKEKIVIDIPSIDRTSKEVGEFRAMIQTMSKDATGSADEFDMQAYRFSIYGRLLMTFKNWIPRMADVRFSEFHYSQSHHAYEYGRFRMLYRGFTSNLMASMAKLIPLPFITGKLTGNLGREDLIKRSFEVYKKKAEETKLLGINLEEIMTEKEFTDKFISGFNSSVEEIRMFLFLTLFLMLGLARADDDDDPEEKNTKKLIRKQIDKMSDEVGFFFNPTSFIDITKNPLPLMFFVQDVYKLTTNFSKEVFGATLEKLGDEEQGAKLREKAKPMKYFFKVVPVLKEILNYMPIFDNELAKDWGIVLVDKRGT